MTARTRFAPSPTGELHLGNARIAVLNWLYARHAGGQFIIRIEDTDADRNVEGAEADLLAALRRLGLDWDEGPDVGGPHGPYRQSERRPVYERRAAELLARGHAFRCYCAPEAREERGDAARSRRERGRRDPCRKHGAERRLSENGAAPSIRYAIGDDPVVVHDRVRGAIRFAAAELDDFVIVKSDGSPTYNFAVVVDDIAMRISHVIRGVGHLSNTPRQLMLYHSLDAAPPEFVHVPHVLAPDGSPLSKRLGAPSLSEYLDRGYHPDALINYLSLLSWSSASGDEVLTRQRLIEEIDLARLGASDVRLDPDKLEWLSGEHIRRMSDAELGRCLAAQLGERFPEPERGGWARVAAALRERITTFAAAAEYRPQLVPPDPMSWSEEALTILQGDGVETLLRSVASHLSRLSGWSGEDAMKAVRAAGKEVGVGGRDLFMPVRAAVTGATQGPELIEVFEIQGKEATLRVLEQALRRLRLDEGGT